MPFVGPRYGAVRPKIHYPGFYRGSTHHKIIVAEHDCVRRTVVLIRAEEIINIRVVQTGEGLRNRAFTINRAGQVKRHERIVRHNLEKSRHVSFSEKLPRPAIGNCKVLRPMVIVISRPNTNGQSIISETDKRQAAPTR